MKKHRTTIFTRLLLFLLIFTPISYLLITYLQEDGLFNKKGAGISIIKYERKSTLEITNELLRNENAMLNKQLDSCKADNLLKADN